MANTTTDPTVETTPVLIIGGSLVGLSASVFLGTEVTFVHIGVDAKPVDLRAFETAYGLGAGGAVLVRPDGYIAWRAPVAPDHPADALTEALRQVAAPVVHGDVVAR